MTYSIKLLSAIIASGLLLPSCTKTTPIQRLEWAGESQFTFTDIGGNGQLSFLSSSDWAAASNADWLTLSATNGSASSDETAIILTMEVTSNDSYDSRTAQVTITSEEKSLTAQITQSPHFAILLDETEYAVDYRAQTLSLTAKSNADLTASIAESCASWISCSFTKGMICFQLVLTFSENTDLQERTGQIYLNDKSAGTSDTISIIQEGLPPVLTQQAIGLYRGADRLIGPDDDITQTAIIKHSSGLNECHIVNVPLRTYCLFRDMKPIGDGISISDTYVIDLCQNMSEALSGKCCLNLYHSVA